jgi:hypothetical protein
MIPDQGTLNETAPARLLLTLYEQKQTGILYFRQNEILKVFYLNRGKISWAISSDEADRIDHVLLAKKLVTPEVLAPYQTGNKISESFGKILVENGILSLDGLIQASREQVRLIASSVLRWSSGNFQLVQESPPNRLVSLDVDIPGIVAQYIMAQMDVNIVWEELGSLSGELQQNLDPAKKLLYALDAEQHDVFSRFQEPKRLESVLLEFPAERKYRILKILYYFLLTGMLKKKEIEKGLPLDFRELDSMFGQSSANISSEVDIEMPAMIDEAAIQDIPLSELPEIAAKQAGKNEAQELPELPDLMPPDDGTHAEPEPPPSAVDRKSVRERPAAQPFRVPEKHAPRWRSVSFLSILLAAAAIGAFLWFTRSGATNEEPAAAAAAKARPRRPAPTKTVPAAQAGGAPVSTAKVPAALDQAPPAGAKTSAPEATPAGAIPKTTQAEAAIPAARRETAAAGPGETEARQRFAAGNFRAAGDIWGGRMLAAKVTYSILLEMDCRKESVRIAYKQVADKENFFLLNKTSRDGRGCWLVLLGRYRTADEAALGMKLVPEYFMKQSDPPSVIELAPYL